MHFRCPLPLAATLALLSATFLPASEIQFGTIGGPQRSFDFGDHSSAFLLEKAWKALEVRDHPAVLAYVSLCIELYERKAVEEQISLRQPVPSSDKERVHSYAALNDVGTAYYILGQLHERRGHTEQAVSAYTFVVERLPFAQCWDLANGWFWKPADAAKGRLRALELER